MKDPNVPAGEVHVWWASLAVSDSEIERLHRLLSPEERRRAERFRVGAAARRFIAARAALRSVLGTATGIDPTDLKFRFGEHGKPHLLDGGPCFNASDTGDFVVVAVTTAEIGIDIEIVRPLGRRDRLARRICTDRELEALARTPGEERDAQLLRLWTCKEAALKAIGTGLPGGARNVEVELPPGGPPKLTYLMGESDGWALLFPDLSPDLLCSAVVRGSNWRAVIRPFILHST
jgi:4'-phosphopantetheinyl transferase